MAVYLIDFENVTSAGISGIQRLTKDDKVYIFYTVNASNMSFAAHMNLLSSPAEVIYYNVASGGKNALDFQLASFLGYLISKGEDKNFCIISNDRGYEHVKSFWEKSGLAEGITINSSPSINRSLLPMERPFTSKIQQTAHTAEMIAENPVTETVRESPIAASENVETAAEKTEISAEIKTESAAAGIPDPEEVMEKKPAKRRGRPKSKKTETKQASEQNTEAAENTAKSANTVQNANNGQKANAAPKKKKSSVPDQNANNGQKTNAAPKKKSSPVPDAVSQSVKNAAAKAGVSSEKEISGIMELLRSADGKQQFYRGLLKIFGMERGVEVYKAVRPEYTNLSKLVR